MNDPEEITPEVAAARERLEAEVSRRQKKLEMEGRELEREQHDSAIAGEPDKILPIGEVMPEILESLTRSREKWKAFCDSTRPAFDAVPEFIGCQDHPTEQRPKLFEETCQASRMASEFTPVYAPCQSCQGREAKAKQARHWARCGVPQRLIQATFANYDREIEEQGAALEKVRRWLAENGVFLILTGTPGTGKGHLAVACMKAHGKGQFITHPDMLADLRASYTMHNTVDIVAGWREAEILVLDEFGVSPGGKDEIPLLYQVLAGRYDAKRPTIITSNLEIAALRESIGFRLLDRITEDCTTVVMRWESHRSKK